MPIPFSDRSQNDEAAQANRRGVLLRSQGKLAPAVEAFREAVAAQGDRCELRSNLATALSELGDLTEARGQFQAALSLDASFVPALAGLGSLEMRAGDFPAARAAYERVLSHDPQHLAAHLAMYEIEQIDGKTGKALYHQRQVLARQTLFSEYAPDEQRRLLVLMAPGDWQANVPVDFLIDRRTTTLHKLYVLSAEQAAKALVPQADVVFTAIAESDENLERLHLAASIAGALGLPVLNDPRKVLRTNRVLAYRALHELPHVNMPRTMRIARDVLESMPADLPFPMVVRPVGSQAGRELEKADDQAALRDYLSRSQAEAYFVMPFVDFSKADGYFRKYRIIIVDGVPYPYHLAISPRWMIHYYNAPMREHQWMRDEERRFLEDFESVFSPELREALASIATTLELEYVGVDCSIDRDGRLLIFEADPAMIVHAGDDPELFGYKIPAAQRVFRAFERLVDRARSR